jgi:hypothetical protein
MIGQGADVSRGSAVTVRSTVAPSSIASVASDEWAVPVRLAETAKSRDARLPYFQVAI